jgi:hypothetical protein
MLLQNDYGEFESSEYTFTTLNDTPSVTYTVNKSGDNSVDVVANFSTPEGASISRAFLEYKNQEENSYKSIELSIDIDNSITINELVQGPQYDYKLTVQNEWNTYSFNKYLNLDVTYAVGDEIFGGHIVYIDASGYHGIVAAKMEDIRRLKWSTTRDLEEDFELSSDGENNTQIILNYYNNTQWSAPAAEYCNNFVSQGYDDWYLASVDEFSFNGKIIQKNMYEKYGGDFIREYNVLWTSNVDSVLSSRAKAALYNGCSNNCVRGQFKDDSEIGVLPIRQF